LCFGYKKAKITIRITHVVRDALDAGLQGEGRGAPRPAELHPEVLQVWGDEQSPEGSGLRVRALRAEVGQLLNAAVNLYLRMEGLPHGTAWFDRVVGGFALTREERDGEPSLGI
jgi:hypothetical protein